MKLPELNYFIHTNESIGSELQKKIKDKPVTSPLNECAKGISYFQKLSDYLLKFNFENIETKRKKSIKLLLLLLLLLLLQKMDYDASLVYLIIEVKIHVYRTNGNKKRKTSYQRLRQDVIYKDKMPHSITDGESQCFVYLLPKFILGDNEKLMIELKELKGSRRMVLETRL